MAKASSQRERVRVTTRRLQYNLAGTAPRSWWRSSPSSSDYKKSRTGSFEESRTRFLEADHWSLFLARTNFWKVDRHEDMANTKSITDKTERKKVKRTARKKAAPKAKRTTPRGENKAKVKKLSRGQSKR
jgi:hypothetical protein